MMIIIITVINVSYIYIDRYIEWYHNPWAGNPIHLFRWNRWIQRVACRWITWWKISVPEPPVTARKAILHPRTGPLLMEGTKLCWKKTNLNALLSWAALKVFFKRGCRWCVVSRGLWQCVELFDHSVQLCPKQAADELYLSSGQRCPWLRRTHLDRGQGFCLSLFASLWAAARFLGLMRVHACIHTHLTLHYITIHYNTLRYITLHCVHIITCIPYHTLHYNTLRYSTLHCSTLHGSTWT